MGRRPHRPLAQALALGAIQGPAELLPISSSAHLVLIPWLARWEYAELDADTRRRFEVLLHAATALALAGVLRRDLARYARELSPRRAASIALACLPAAALGAAIDRRGGAGRGDPAAVALGLLGGSAAMALAELRAPRERVAAQVGLRDGVWLGLGQAAALLPGVSRSGATLAVARARGFTRADSQELSRQIALPVIAGAGLLAARGVRRDGVPAGQRLGYLAGSAAAFASTWACGQLSRRVATSLLPFAAYRAALAAAVLHRLRRDRDG